jgi:uncharacterized protein YggE
VALALLAVPLLPTAAAAPPNQEPGTPHTLTVTGTGTAYGTPDVVQVGLGVETSNADIQVAMNDASNLMNAVIKALEDGGVDQKDIRTDSFNIYQDNNQPAPGSPQSQTGQPIYRVSTTVAVTVRQTDKVGDLLAAAVNAGANTVNYIQFSIENRTALESQARQLAVSDAHARAEELAGLLGVTLGDPLQVSEGSSGPTPVFGGGVSMAAAVAAPPISQGTLSVDMSVTITYAISSAS